MLCCRHIDLIKPNANPNATPNPVTLTLTLTLTCTELEDSLAEVLANGEDMLDTLKRTSSFNGEHCEELKKTYGQVHGAMRSPT